MTPEAQQIAIATHCGKCTHGPIDWIHDGTDGDMELVCTKYNADLRDVRPPDYLKDLNAMADAERTLETDQQIETYREAIAAEIERRKA